MRKTGIVLMVVGAVAFMMPAIWEPVDPQAWPINPDGWWMAAGAAIVVIGWALNRRSRA